jgi:predicted outer membrane repeat protein
LFLFRYAQCRKPHSSEGDAGAIDVEHSELAIINTEFINCVAAVGGGAILLKSATGTISDTVFNGTFSFVGGAIYAVNVKDTFQVSGSTFYQNVASFDGGAISATLSDIYLESSDFVQNLASSG